MENKNIQNIPKTAGVYFFKDQENNIIYIGKSKNLSKRVASYFPKQNIDWKVKDLIQEHKSIEHIATKNEIEALLLEAYLIRYFKPKYNVLLKGGNPFLYICITQEKNKDSKIILARTKSHKGTYFGPFLYKQKARYVYNYLIKTFKLKQCSGKIKNGCLNFHLGNCAGNCVGKFNSQDYLKKLELIKKIFKSSYKDTQKYILDQIKNYNNNLEFEKAKNLNNYLENLEDIINVVKSGFKETKYIKEITVITSKAYQNIKETANALEELKERLNLEKEPITIDCFDISHFQSNYIVGSCVRFSYGIPEKNLFRRFKIKTLNQQNDYEALKEIVLRRYKNLEDLPDLVLIDGGKGQLSSIESLNLPIKCLLSLAKKEEIIYSKNLNNNKGLKLNLKNNMGKLLISIRDYAHHFAISYHRLLRKKYLK